MSQTGGQEDRRGRSLQQAELVARLIDGDGDPADDVAAELADLLRASPGDREALVEQLLLDSLLRDELGSESLSALVDVVADGGAVPSAGAAAPAAADGTRGAAVPASGRAGRPRARRAAPRSGVPRWRTVGWVGAAAVTLASLVIGIVLRDRAGAANAAHVIQVAEAVHAEPVERVYLVDVVREADATADFVPPRDTRVATQGDRFYVEMRRGDRHWFWGRDAAGATWITVGRSQAVIVHDDEQGPTLRHLGELYTLNLETLLRTFRTFCRLAHSTGTVGTHVIDVTPRVAFKRGGLRHATIEVDRETKAVRRLVLEREFPHYGRSTVTFTLVDTRPADEVRYGPLGHLEEPAVILDRAMGPGGLRDLLETWFGSQANRWIRVPEEARDVHGLGRAQNPAAGDTFKKHDTSGEAR
jgi:hypothetical protein